MHYKIAVLPGDGIGPEVMDITMKVLETTASLYNFTYDHEFAAVGGAALDKYDEPLPQETVDLCEKSDAILFGSVGGPKWEKLPPEKQPERGSLLVLRRHFGFFANIRPVLLFPNLMNISPLKNRLVENGLDMVIIRELTGGIYFGQPKGIDKDKAFNTLTYSRHEVERIVRLAFETAQKRRKKLHSIDKANVLLSMVFWRDIVNELAVDYPDVEVEHLYVDNAAIQLIKNPAQFDVIVTTNLFGDILSDEGGAIIGSLGMLPSASLNEKGFGLYEPSGGSAPDIAGQNIANPIAQVLSMAMMLKYSFKMEQSYLDIMKAVKNTLDNGYRTGDIWEEGGTRVSTSEMGEQLIKELKQIRSNF